MNNMLQQSAFFGVMISLLSYGIGLWMKKKWKISILNPLLISIVLTVVIVLCIGMDYETYYEGAKYISYLLTPATICLAIPLYEQVQTLKKHWKAIMGGVVSGVVTSLISVFMFSLLFRFDHKEYVTLLPKSITTAIGMGVSEELGGYVTITIAVIIITGVFGNIIAELICKVFKIEDPIAKGIAIGTSSHAVGTVKAMEIGAIEGAMSSLSIAVAGLLTVVGASIFANFI